MRSAALLLTSAGATCALLLGCGAAAPIAEPAGNANPSAAGSGVLPPDVREAILARPVSMDLWIGDDVLGPGSAVDPEIRARIECSVLALEAWARESGGRLVLAIRVVGADTSIADADAAGVDRHFQYPTPGYMVPTYLELYVHVPGAEDAFLSLLDEPADLERRLVRAIRHAAGIPTRIGVVAGTAATTPEPPLGVELVTIERGGTVPDDVGVLYVVAPVPPFSTEETAWLDGLVRGGRRVVVLDRAVELSELSATTLSATTVRSNGLEAWLVSNGVTVEPTLAGSTACGRVPLRTELGIPVPVEYPPIVEPVEGAWIDDDRPVPQLLFASPVRLAAGTEGSTIWTATDAWTLGPPPIDLRIRPASEWAVPPARAEFPLGIVLRLGAGELVVVGTPSLFDGAYLVADETALEPALRLAFAGAPLDEPSTLAACP